MTKMYLQSFVTFTRNEVRGTHLVFQKRRSQGFISEILRVARLLGETFTFSTPLGQPRFPGVSDFLFILRSRVRIEVRPTENDSTRLYKNGDISVVYHV